MKKTTVSDRVLGALMYFFVLVRFLGGINKKRTSKLPEGPIPDFPSDDKLPPLPANFGELKSDLAVLNEVKAWQKDYHYPTDAYTEKT